MCLHFCKFSTPCFILRHGWIEVRIYGGKVRPCCFSYLCVVLSLHVHWYVETLFIQIIHACLYVPIYTQVDFAIHGTLNAIVIVMYVFTCILYKLWKVYRNNSCLLVQCRGGGDAWITALEQQANKISFNFIILLSVLDSCFKIVSPHDVQIEYFLVQL